MQIASDNLSSLINRHVDGDFIDLPALTAEMQVEVLNGEGASVDKGKFLPAIERARPHRILLNQHNQSDENRTVVALLLAEHILAKVNGNDDRILEVDVFALRNLRQMRTSHQLVLATRLAIPEHIINQVGELNFDMGAYARNARLMNSFVACAHRNREGQLLINLLDNVDVLSR